MAGLSVGLGWVGLGAGAGLGVGLGWGWARLGGWATLKRKLVSSKMKRNLIHSKMERCVSTEQHELPDGQQQQAISIYFFLEGFRVFGFLGFRVFGFLGFRVFRV